MMPQSFQVPFQSHTHSSHGLGRRHLWWSFQLPALCTAPGPERHTTPILCLSPLLCNYNLLHAHFSTWSQLGGEKRFRTPQTTGLGFKSCPDHGRGSVGGQGATPFFVLELHLQQQFVIRRVPGQNRLGVLSLHSTCSLQERVLERFFMLAAIKPLYFQP
eukprot:jgi/Botrbrau1/18590/Bobra.0367s0032.1